MHPASNSPLLNQRLQNLRLLPLNFLKCLCRAPRCPVSNRRHQRPDMLTEEGMRFLARQHRVRTHSLPPETTQALPPTSEPLATRLSRIRTLARALIYTSPLTQRVDHRQAGVETPPDAAPLEQGSSAAPAAATRAEHGSLPHANVASSSAVNSSTTAASSSANSSNALVPVHAGSGAGTPAPNQPHPNTVPPLRLLRCV